MCTRNVQAASLWAGRPTKSNPLSGCSGRPGGRPAREPLLSGSGRGRPGGRLTGRPDQEPIDRSRPDVHTNVHKAISVGRSTERSTDWRQPTLGLFRSTGRSTGQRAVTLWFWARSTGRSTGRFNGQFFDCWPVDRPVDRKAILGLISCQRADSFRGYIYPIWGLFCVRFLERKIPDLFKCFQQNVLGSKFLISICF